MDLYDSMLQSATAQRLQRARVRAVPAQHSWAALPGPFVSKLLDSQAQTPLVLKLIPAPTAASQSGRSPFSNSSSTPAAPSSLRPRYIAWAGAVSTTPGCIELPAHLCAALQLPTGCEVLLEVVPALAAAVAVVVEPVGPADWEVVELNAGLLEEHVLGQAGVVVLGQPLVVWARQAKVTLKVTQIIHDNTAAAGAAAAAVAAAAPGRQLYVRDVARLDQGTELHIAPKPRVTATGSSLAPGALPLSAAAAAAESDKAQQQTGANVQQQQAKQQRKPVFLRICNAGAQHLLATSSLLGHNGISSTSRSNNIGHSPTDTAEARASSVPVAAQGAAAAVSSWLTTAVHISRQTSQDLSLQPGEIVRLYGGGGSSSNSSSSKGQSVLPLQSLVVAVLIQDAVPWGHVALSPPLQQGLGLREHQFVKLRPLQKQKQLQQLPGFLLHPLMPAGVVSNSSSGSGLEGVFAAASYPGNAAAAAAAGSKDTAASGMRHSSAQQQQQQQQGRQQAGSLHKHEVQQVSQQQGSDSFSGPGLVLDTVKGLLTMPLQVIRLQSSLQQQAQQQAAANKPQQQQPQQSQGDRMVPVSAAGPVSTVGDSVGGVLVDGLVKPKVAAAALLAWLQVQLAAAAAAAVDGRAALQPGLVPAEAQVQAGSKETGLQGAHGATASSSWTEVCLPVCGPMLVHFRVGPQQQQQQESPQQKEEQQPSSASSSCDYLLLLVPLGEQHQGAAGVAGVSYLPAHSLLPSTGNGQHAQQQQVKQLSLQVARPLTIDPTAAQADLQVSQVAQQHSQYVSCIYSSSTGPQAMQHTQGPQAHHHQQQQQQRSVTGWLDPGEYPWLNPALQSGLQRLHPRLDLLMWQSWQSVELPLPGGVLLVGSSEGGRGWLMQLMGQEAATRHGAHVLKVSCKSLAGQSYETAAAVLASAAAEAVSCCPGLLLLDDLDLLMPAPNTEGPAGLEQDQATATRLADWLSGLMQWAAKQPRPLSVCAAVSAAAALPASLRAAGCLDCEVKVPALGSQGRAALLLSGFRAKGLGFEGGLQGLEALAGKGLEGFDAKDLQLIVDRAVHSALRKGMVARPPASAAAAANGHNDAAQQAVTGSGTQPQQTQQQQQLLVTSEDVQQALCGFIAAAFWRAGQHKGQQQKAEGGLEGWQDVGGLSDAVSALKEALVLPAKYGHLLAAAPLRLRTGLLLFGPPGCGKTHVVAAAVAATGTRLISVKGPELLNKYIGQSEAAVRELFSRAAAAAPCVLFFDEFDAIAPPRGHDSTGVTDRVVNQLLTELDGVEGLTGVAVLAATSRPDLIDAALLRPGRLDRMVYCGFPGDADRLAILQAVSRKLALSADVSLQDIARSTAGFTGADLAAILSEAQLLAVHDQIDAHPDQQQQETQEKAGVGHAAAACVLNAQHAHRALSRARPSLPATEKQRLEAVYARFQQSRDPGLSNRPAVPEEEQMRVKHATLA